MTRYFIIAIMLIFVFKLVQAQDLDYEDYLKKADSLIFLQDIQGSKSFVAKAKESYFGKEEGIIDGIVFRDSLLRNFTEGEGEDSVIIKQAEQIINYFLDKDFSNQVKIYYTSYLVEALIQEQKDPAYTMKMINLCLSLFEEIDDAQERDSISLVHILHNKGNILTGQQKYKEAKENIGRAIAINARSENRDSMLWGVMLYNLANAVYYDGDEVGAFKIVEESEEFLYSSSQPNLDYLTAIYSELSTYYKRIGFFDKSIFYINKSYDLFQKFASEITKVKRQSKDEVELYYCYLFVHNYSGDQGELINRQNLEKALVWKTKAESHYQKVEKNKKNRTVMAAVYNYLGEIYVDLSGSKNKMAAVRNYDKAYEILGNKSDYTRTLQYLFNKSKAYLYDNKFHQSLAIIKSVIESAESINDSRLPYFYTMEAHALLRSGSFDKAINRYQKVFNMVDQNENKFDLRKRLDASTFKSNAGLVDAFLIGGSGAYIKDSVAGNEETWIVALNMLNFGMKQFDENFAKSKVNDYVHAEYEKLLFGIIQMQERLNLDTYSDEHLLAMSEKVSSKYLWEKFQENHRELELVDEELVEREKMKRKELVSLKRTYLKLKEDSIQQKIHSIEFELDKIQKEKEKNYPNYIRYSEFEFNVADFQNNLSDNDLVLKFELVQDHLVKYEIDREQLLIHNLGEFKNNKLLIDSLIELSRKPTSSQEKILASGAVLYKNLIGGSKIEGKNLIIVPDDVLSYLPFDLLNKDGSYLFENNQISYATALSLLNLNEDNEVVTRVGIFAPSYDSYTLSPQQLAVRGSAYNLQGAIAEANAISELLGSKLFIKEEANKKSFIESAANFEVLHLSMHSFLNDEDPELSSLVFSDSETDNELYISELYGLNLDASMAVLSACNTGVGKEKTGEGVVSMTRAFTYAGVPSVVSTLWSAPDQATKEIMTSFYQELKKGKSKAEALQSAKMAYIKNQDLEAVKHPYFWAGFILHGNTNALEFKTDLGVKKWVIPIFTIVLVLALGIAFRQNRKKAA